MFGDDFFDEFKRMRKEMERMQEHMDRVFGQVLKGLPSQGMKLPAKGAWKMPACDVRETETGVVAAIELPGVDKKDISLRVNETSMEVRAKAGQRKEITKKGSYQAFASAQEYYRVIPLPVPVQADKAKASYKNGMLRVEAPRAKGAQGGRVKID